jgi:nucleoside-diphosphate-sugar epimerase
MNFNVFYAEASLGLGRVVWASSETTLGLPFGVGKEQEPFLETGGLAPRSAPVDEDLYPVPMIDVRTRCRMGPAIRSRSTSRSGRGYPSSALRYSNIMLPDDYQEFPSFWPDPYAQVEPVGLRGRPGCGGRPAAWPFYAAV